MRAESKSSPDRPLTSWKEIAQFLERSVRTVQGWEKKEALPVHRHLHHRQSSVYAYPEELQAWWRERGAQLPAGTATAKLNSWILAGALLAGLLLVGLIVWVTLPKGSAPEAAPVFCTIALDGTHPQGYLVGGLTGDLNGDGKDDVVLSAPKAHEIYVLLGGSLPAGGGELPGSASVVITSADAGWLWAVQIGDFNGDGMQDLLLSRLLEGPESFRTTGSSYILWGRRRWPKSLTLPDAADVTLRLDWSTDARMAGCIASGSSADLNGDGIADVLLAAHEYGFAGLKSTGALFVLFGRKQWERELEVASAADLTIRGSRSGEGLGAACSVGAPQGDRGAELTIYASEDTLWNLLGGRGRIYDFLGRKLWPAQLEAQTDFNFRVTGVRPKAYTARLLLADLNGDGRDDLIVGWPRFNDAPAHPGEVHIWFGRENRKGLPADAADVVITGSSPGAQLGDALTATDIDRDGIQDLIVAEPGRGAIHLLYGRREWKKNGRLQDYAPVKLFQGEAGTELADQSR